MRVNPKGGWGLSGVMAKLKFGAAVAVGLEVVSLVGSFILWRKMNKDQDFRYKVHQTAPYALNYYYKVGEKLGGSTVRLDDAKAWGIKTT